MLVSNAASAAIDIRGIGMKSLFRIAVFSAALSQIAAFAAVFGGVRGVVHDPDHRPVPAAEVIVKSTTSDYSRKLKTNADGEFEATALPPGAYSVTVSRDSFAPSVQQVVIGSGSAPILHFQLAIGSRSEQVTVAESAL
ncbi:MAG TPA: carboxypeptidase-like regulatory domain-containing protein, partial [Bryobacteraceae bacterium]|nr:carboxypeptidase-like regulatory domain-containing protein [Bryobacteraceae bacterium]